MFVLCTPYLLFHIYNYVKVTEWPPIGKIAAHSAYDMFSLHKYLIVNLVFPLRFLEWEYLSDCAFS